MSAALAAEPDPDIAAITGSLERPELFTAVFDRYYPPVHRYLAQRVGQEIADDLASEVFLVAFDRRARYEPAQGSARPWLYGIATNLLHRHRRSEARRYRALARSTAAWEAAERDHQPVEHRLDDLAVQGEYAATLEALSRLAPHERDLLTLLTWEDFSYEQAAAAFGLPVGTVRSRTHRARAKLRRLVEQGS